MPKITVEILNKTKLEDWNDFYLESGEEMLSLAAKSLESKKENDVEIGLKIVERSLFEEHEENPDSATGLEDLDFTKLIPLLAKKLKDYPEDALKSLHACFINGAKANKLEASAVEPFLEDKKLKELAFRVLVHVHLQKKNGNALLNILKDNKTLLGKLFDELGTYAARDYDQSPFVALVMKNLSAKGEAPVRTAVESLWNLLRSGTDISGALPILVENEARFGMFTNSNQLIAGIYLKTKKFEEMKKWVMSVDDRQAARALRGLRVAHTSGISAESFLNETGLRNELVARAKKLRVPSLDE